MADKSQVIKEKLEHSGLFDFSGFYKFTHAWLMEEGLDVTETDYKESVSNGKRDISYKWACIRGVSDYFKHEVKLDFKVNDLVEVEVEVDGKKKKMNKGKIGIEIKGTLIRDPDSKWDSTPLNRFMRDVYNKYVIPGTVDSQENKIIGDVVKLKEEIKSYLDLSGKRS